MTQKHFYVCDVPGCNSHSPEPFDAVIELRYGTYMKLTVDLCHECGTYGKMQAYQAKLLDMLKETKK